ncbi:MAG: hypothetical protein SVG88_05990 [Halobacteriales archaeon]|nr:hypothetical protein [Halobacteriales archaeon]
MIVVDTSSLITLASVDVLSTVLDEYDTHTTETVVQELKETSRYDDTSAEAAETVLDRSDRITIHRIDNGEFYSSRIDPGEGSCALLTKELDADFLITDDLRALPELQTVADSKVAISPFILKALVQRGILERKDAVDKVDQIAEIRDWLGAPIYRRARQLFNNE